MIWEIDESSREIEGLDRNGKPVASYAASLGLLPAPFGRRVGATVIEAIVVALLQLPLVIGVLPTVIAAAMSPDPVGAITGRSDLLWLVIFAAASSVLTTAFIVVQLVLHGRRGVTLGKAFLGIRSVNARTLERPGFWRGAVVRYLVLLGSFLVPLVGSLLVVALSPLFDPDRRGRGWPDFAADTWFVDIRKGLNPYDAKRIRIARKTAAAKLHEERTALPSLATPVGARAQDVYIPTARSRGGVLGAPRTDGSPAPAPAAAFQDAVVSEVPGFAPAASPSAAPTSVPVPAPVPAAAPTLASTPDPVPTPAPAPAPTLALVLDSGETLAIIGDGILIGRSPAAGPGEAALTLVAIADPTMSVSKTHLAVLRREGAVFVADRGSTNGSSLTRNGVEHVLLAGESAQLENGDSIRFGDRFAQVRIG